jgi:hypothetical protein
VRRPKGCPACEHPECRLLDALLCQGLAPRAIVRRVGGISRRQLTRHRDEGHHGEANERSAA